MLRHPRRTRALLMDSFSLDRVFDAVNRVRERLLKASAVLRAAGVPYAIAGGHAVALWVTRVDAAAARTTQDVDILLRRADFAAATAAMEAAGFVRHEVAGVEMFLDGPGAGPRDAVHVVFANEKVRAHEPVPSPGVEESEESEHFRVLSLEALVRTKLTAFQDKDRTHLRDMIGVGLVDERWIGRLPPVLAGRLQGILETPE